MTGLFRYGNFPSHSGLHLRWKIECDALTDDDWRSIASVVAPKIAFGNVYGVPTGGEKFAEALMPYRMSNSPIILIVDDVLTTGKSMEEARARFKDSMTKGLVLFSRSEFIPAWIIPVFTVNSLFH